MKQCVVKQALVLFFVTMFLVGTLIGAVAVRAQEAVPLAKQIQGNWILVSVYNENDGKKSEPYGPDPKGMMVLTPEGRFSMILIKAGLPKFASNNRLTGTAEENKAIIQGSEAQVGTYKVASEKENKVVLHFEASTLPNRDGQDLPRIINVSGDEMKVINPTVSSGGTNYLIWKRAK